jgi:hypothetical protein
MNLPPVIRAAPYELHASTREGEEGRVLPPKLLDKLIVKCPYLVKLELLHCNLTIEDEMDLWRKHEEGLTDANYTELLLLYLLIKLAKTAISKTLSFVL